MVVLASALLIAVAIFVMRENFGGSDNAISLSYVVPVALIALELGLWPGLAAAIVASGAVLVWMLGSPTDIGPGSFVARIVSYVAVALIAGRFSDIMRATRARDERLLRAGIDLARLEEADSLARLLVEHVQNAVDVASVVVTLDGAQSISVGEPAGEQLRLPILSHGMRLGCINVSAGSERRFKDEERLTLETLALQAAIASDNQRLLSAQREQAMLQSEIERMRRRLDEQARNASHLIERHEQERRGIGRQLHEEAAQTMAAALLTVTLLERAPAELSQPQLEEVRGQVKASIADLRRLAATLRPTVLDELGLASALARVAEVEAERSGRSVTFSTHGLPERLPAEVETSTYRAIEEVLDALRSAPAVAVGVHAEDSSMRIVIEADSLVGGDLADAAARAGCRGTVTGVSGHVRAELAATRARLELIGGSLHIGSLSPSGARIVAELPIGGG